MNIKYKILDKEDGIKEITRKDIFVERMNTFERSMKLKKNTPVSVNEYLSFIKKSVLEWKNHEKERINRIIASIIAGFDDKNVVVEININFIKTNGSEEFMSAYTRGNSIFLPKNKLEYKDEQLERLIIHEIFHIITRNYKDLRNNLYNTIGYQVIKEIELISEINNKRLTNPDTPVLDYFINLKHKGKCMKLVPIIMLKNELSEIDTSKDIFDSIEMRFVRIEKGAFDNYISFPVTYTVDDTEDYYDQVGNNFDYINQPEEILAEHFVMLIKDDSEIKDPEVIDKMRIVFEQFKEFA